MQRMELEAQSREVGKSAARKLRKEGRIPAVMYGRGAKPRHLSIDTMELQRLERSGGEGFNFLVDLKIDGKETALAMVRDFQADVLKRNLTHLDFQEIDINQKLEIEVPVVLNGTPVGVKDGGGVVDQHKWKISIRALPANIPPHVEVDISELNIGDSVHADEVKLPEGVEFPHAVNYTVVAVVPPTKIEAPVVEAVPVEGEVVEAAEGEEEAAGAKEPEGKKEGEGSESK